MFYAGVFCVALLNFSWLSSHPGVFNRLFTDNLDIVTCEADYLRCVCVFSLSDYQALKQKLHSCILNTYISLLIHDRYCAE